MLSAANKSGAKTIEDWKCPSGSVSPTSAIFNRRHSAGDSASSVSVSSSSSADVRPRALDSSRMYQEDQRAVGNGRKPGSSTSALSNSYPHLVVDGGKTLNDVVDRDSLPVHVVLLVLATLLVTMVAIGVLSYCQAVRK